MKQKLSVFRIAVGGGIGLCALALIIMFFYYTGLFVPDPAGYDTERSGTGLKIVSFTGEDSNVKIPDHIGSKPVVEIGENAFQNNSAINKVTVPDTVKKVGDKAFADCKNLETVEFKAEFTTMGSSVFENSAVSQVELPSKLRKISDSMFKNCKNVTKVTFPDNLMGIGKCAFQGCTAINSMIIGGEVKKIGKDAFADCGTDFKISSVIGSVTEKYALENDIEYVPCNDYYEIYTIYPLYTGSNKLNSQDVSEGKRGLLCYTPSNSGYYRVTVENSEEVHFKITSALKSVQECSEIRHNKDDYFTYFEAGSKYFIPVTSNILTDYVVDIQPVSKRLVDTYKEAEKLLKGKSSINLSAGTPLRTNHSNSSEVVAEVSTSTTLTQVKDYYIESQNNVWYKIETNSNGSKQSRWFKA